MRILGDEDRSALRDTQRITGEVGDSSLQRVVDRAWRRGDSCPRWSVLRLALKVSPLAGARDAVAALGTALCNCDGARALAEQFTRAPHAALTAHALVHGIYDVGSAFLWHSGEDDEALLFEFMLEVGPACAVTDALWSMSPELYAELFRPGTPVVGRRRDWVDSAVDDWSRRPSGSERASRAVFLQELTAGGAQHALHSVADAARSASLKPLPCDDRWPSAAIRYIVGSFGKPYYKTVRVLDDVLAFGDRRRSAQMAARCWRTVEAALDSRETDAGRGFVKNFARFVLRGVARLPDTAVLAKNIYDKTSGAADMTAGASLHLAANTALGLMQSR